MRRFLCAVLIAGLLAVPTVCADDAAEDDGCEELQFPEWVYTARRAEIVTLGSLPFTTLGVTLAYSTYQYATGRTDSLSNPFDKSSSGYDTGDIQKIIGISLGVSAIIGLVDFIVGTAQKKKAARSASSEVQDDGAIRIVPRGAGAEEERALPPIVSAEPGGQGEGKP